MNKKLFLIGGIAAMLFSSCDQDITNVINLPGGESSNTPATQKEITFTASMDGMNTRAVETTIANLGSFVVNNKYSMMQDVKYISSDNGTTWTTDAGKFYWNISGTHNFYAYGPAEPGKSVNLEYSSGYSGYPIINFSPNEDAASQKDLVFATASGTYAVNGDSPVNLVFKHVLSEISIKAKNSNTDYIVKVKGVELGNIWEKALYNYRSGSNGAWDKWTNKDYRKDYRTTWDNPVTLTSEASSLDAANVPFMLIPQQLTANNKNVTQGNYIAALITIEKDGQTIFNDWSYTPIDTNWKIGKHYVYTLDFSNWLGKDSSSVDIAFKTITASVSVKAWEGKEEIDLGTKGKN